MTDDASSPGTPTDSETTAPITPIGQTPPASPDAPAATAAPGAPDAPDAPDGKGPIDPDFPRTVSKAGLTSAVSALGTGLLAAAVVISAVRSRSGEDGDLDPSVFGVGLGATAVLLAVALLGVLAARREVGGRAREEAVTWPGVFGILATSLMIDVGIDRDDAWVGYLIGTVITVLSVLGYLATRRAAFAVTAILGLGILYVLAFDDLLADRIGDEHVVAVAAAVIAVFVVGVTLVGWLLPSRHVTGVAVGAVGIAAFVGLLAVVVIARMLAGVLAGMFGEPSDPGGATGGEGGEDGIAEAMLGGGVPDADIWWVLVLAGVLTLIWALAASVSNRSGYALLAIVMPALVVPLATVALAVEHPTYWEAVLAAAGGVLLLGGVLLAWRRGRKVARELGVGTAR